MGKSEVVIPTESPDCYMAAFMEKPSLPPLTYSVDLSGLK
jgi:hypothetical protein